VNMGGGGEKRYETRNALEGYERERKTLYESLVIARRTNEGLFCPCPKASIVEHYE